MPSEYILKNPVMDLNRIQKLSTKILQECSEDRKLALGVHAYFKEMVDENPQDSAAKNLMVECLKLAQSSKTNAIKVITLLSKLELDGGGNEKTKGGFSSFKELEALANEQKD